MELIYRQGIQSPSSKALGDCWMDLNYFINRGLANNEITRLANWYYKRGGKKRTHKLAEILPLLEHNERVELVEDEPTIPKIYWKLMWQYPYIPTTQTWSPNCSRKICYQFDAQSKKPAKFPSEEIENIVLEHAQKLGYEVVRLGYAGPRGVTLKSCIEEAATAELFLGVDSGLAKLISSVGTPMLFTQNNRPLEFSCNQANKHFVLAKDYIELMACMDAYKEGGIEYYIANATHVDLFTRRQNVS